VITTSQGDDGPDTHVRVRRGRVTAFVTVDLNDRSGCKALRDGAARALSVDDPTRLRLVRRQSLAPLDGETALAEQGVKNDDVLIAVIRVDGSDEWESPDASDPAREFGSAT
jgi:hypothetical protein